MNYYETFIAAAGDCPVTEGQPPLARPSKVPSAAPTIAEVQYDLLAASPYKYTQEDVQWMTHVRRKGLPGAHATTKARAQFLAKPMACLRASPLAKRWGWGFHFDVHGHIALVAAGSTAYTKLAKDPKLTQLNAMRNKRQ